MAAVAISSRVILAGAEIAGRESAQSVMIVAPNRRQSSLRRRAGYSDRDVIWASGVE